MTVETGLKDKHEAIAQLRELINEHAARLGEVSNLVEELFALLYELECELKAGRTPVQQEPAEVIQLQPKAGSPADAGPADPLSPADNDAVE